MQEKMNFIKCMGKGKSTKLFKDEDNKYEEEKEEIIITQSKHGMYN